MIKPLFNERITRLVKKGIDVFEEGNLLDNRTFRVVFQNGKEYSHSLQDSRYDLKHFYDIVDNVLTVLELQLGIE